MALCGDGVSWRIPLSACGFPQPLAVTLPNMFTVSALDLFWAALTVGRPNLQAVFQHGQFSIDEAIWRIGMVTSNLNLASPLTGLSHSPAFAALDPTEKGWVNFSLGMVFAKICSLQLLHIPLLFHFKWYQRRNQVTMLPGGSTPDFIGESLPSGQYYVVEAKGRNAGFSQTVMTKAKAQATQAVSVNGNVCSLHVGTLIYRLKGGQVAMAMEDPETDDRPLIELTDTRETWAEYYRTVWGLSQMNGTQKEAFQSLTGLSVEIHSHVEDEIRILMSETDDASWKDARERLKSWSASDEGTMLRILEDDAPRIRTFPDGVKLAYKSPERNLRLPE